MSDVNPSWQVFAALHPAADSESVHRSLVCDEALAVILDEIVRDPATDEDFIRKRFDSLCRNRTAKQNDRRALVRRHFRGTQRRGGIEFGNVLLTVPTRTVFDRLAYAELTDLIGTVLSKQELRLLLEIADGDRYADIARDRNMTVSGLKSKAFRIRQKVRKSRISAALQCGLQR